MVVMIVLYAIASAFRGTTTTGQGHSYTRKLSFYRGFVIWMVVVVVVVGGVILLRLLVEQL
jgi:hypothetical protein